MKVFLILVIFSMAVFISKQDNLVNDSIESKKIVENYLKSYKDKMNRLETSNSLLRYRIKELKGE